MTVLTARDLKKSFGSRTILGGVSLAIDTGELVGLVGMNGSGKSTLARILAGAEPCDGGVVSRRRNAEIAYLPQEPSFDPQMSARAVVLSGLRAWSEAKARHEQASAAIARGEADLAASLAAQEAAAADVERLGGWERMHQVDAILGHVGVTRLEAKMGELSGGDRRRVALAAVLVARPALAILDEPSNHLDAETIEWLEGYLATEHRGAVLLVTHDRYLLDRVVTRTLELHRGELYAYQGGYEDFLEAKAERLALEARTEQNRQNFLRRELEWLRRQPKARSCKQQARIDRAEAARDIAAPKADRTAELAISSAPSGKTILELCAVSLERGGERLVRELSLLVRPGERIGVVGRNGAGKTTLLQAIAGELAPCSGEVVLGKHARVAYFDQHREELDPAATVFETVSQASARIELAGQSFDVRSYLERFLFDGYQQRQPVGSLSGGERARVALARMLARRANVLLLDEPTNDLDLPTLGALEEMLVESGGAAIVVTHDRWLLDRIATSILVFEGDGRVVRHAGGYRDYRLRREAAQAEAQSVERELAAAAPRSPSAEARAGKSAPAARRGLTYAERIELDGILDRIDQAEQAVRALEAELGDPSLYASRGAEVAGLVDRLARSRESVAALVARWEELEGRR